MTTAKKVLLSIAMIAILAALEVGLVWKFSADTIRKAGPTLAATDAVTARSRTPGMALDPRLVTADGPAGFGVLPYAVSAAFLAVNPLNLLVARTRGCKATSLSENLRANFGHKLPVGTAQCPL